MCFSIFSLLSLQALDFFLACQVYQKWVNGDTNLDIELQGALSEKSPKFVCGDISILKDVVQEHVSSAEKKMIALGKAGPTIEAANIERQAFDIAVANFNHDLGVYKVWFTRNQDREAAVFFQELQHKQARKSQAKKVVQNLMDRGVAGWCVKLCDMSSPAACLQEYQAMRSQIMKLETLSSKDQVLTLVLLNWAAPSTFSSEQQQTQSSVCGALVNSEGALGSVLTPVWTHKKGQLFKLEEAANKLLNSSNLNSDTVCVAI